MNRYVGTIKRQLNIIKTFGISYFVKSAMAKITKGEEGYISELLSFLETDFKQVIRESNSYEGGAKVDKNIVWSFWWQGEEQLPEILKVCYASHKKYITAENIEYIFITKDNYSDYVSIPNYIIDKLNKGIISLTHFSDYLRIALIEKYGGAWIDVTLLLTDNINFEEMNSEFYSFNLTNTEHKPYGVGQKLTGCKWAGFFLACNMSNGLIFHFVKRCLEEYWLRYDYPIDYFFMNAFLAVGYKNNQKIREIIDNVNPNNPNMYRMQPMLNDLYDECSYNELIENTKLFKVTQKKASVKEINGSITLYGKIYSEYFA